MLPTKNKDPLSFKMMQRLSKVKTGSQRGAKRKKNAHKLLHIMTMAV